MVNSSAMSSLLSFRASRSSNIMSTPRKQKNSASTTAYSASASAADQQDDLSIMSIYTCDDRSQRYTTTASASTSFSVAGRSSSGETTTNKKKKGRNSSDVDYSSASCASVVSDVTFNGMLPPVLENDNDENDGDDVSLDSSTSNHEFIIHCKNNERIYVPSMQGKLIKSRCSYFRLLLRSGGGIIHMDNNSEDDADTTTGGSSSTSINSKKTTTTTATTTTATTKKDDNRILTKETWSSRTVRQLIELLTEGTTWIENDHEQFEELSRACEEVDVRLCLGSLINNHDILDRASTYRFFQLRNIQKYKFKLMGKIQSWQWMNLLQKGILLLLESKVLMFTVSPPSDGTRHLPTTSSSTSSKIVTKIVGSSTSSSTSSSSSSSSSVGGRRPKQQRLLKCDDLYSEFCVYSERSKINVLYTILSLCSIRNSNSNSNSNSSDRISCLLEH